MIQNDIVHFHMNVGTGSRSFFWFVLQTVNRWAYNVSSCFCCRTMDGALSFLSSTDMTHHLCLLQYNTCTSPMHFYQFKCCFCNIFSVPILQHKPEILSLLIRFLQFLGFFAAALLNRASFGAIPGPCFQF